LANTRKLTFPLFIATHGTVRLYLSKLEPNAPKQKSTHKPKRWKWEIYRINWERERCGLLLAHLGGTKYRPIISNSLQVGHDAFARLSDIVSYTLIFQTTHALNSYCCLSTCISQPPSKLKWTFQQSVHLGAEGGGGV
jgi:hypothetical protein